jgi:hypothetical protein
MESNGAGRRSVGALVVRVGTRTGAGWWLEALLLGGFLVLTLALANGLLLDLDIAVRDWSDAHRPRVPYLLARGLNFAGSANLVAPIILGISAMVAAQVRSIRPVLPLIAGFVIAYVLIVPLKMVADRAAPHSPAVDPVQIFHHPPGWSYPSGHVANTVLGRIPWTDLPLGRHPAHPGRDRRAREVAVSSTRG